MDERVLGETGEEFELDRSDGVRDAVLSLATQARRSLDIPPVVLPESTGIYGIHERFMQTLYPHNHRSGWWVEAPRRMPNRTLTF